MLRVGGYILNIINGQDIMNESIISCNNSPLLRILGIIYYKWRINLFTTASRTALGPTQPPIQWIPGALSLGVKRQGHEADHSPTSSAEVKQ
jgi:hypothetical protein